MVIEASGDLAAGDGGCGRSSRANGVEVAVKVELDAMMYSKFLRMILRRYWLDS